MARVSIIDPATLRPAHRSPPPTALVTGPMVKRRAAAPPAARLGEPVSSDIEHNCATCQRFTGCRDPNRDHRYRCSRWEELAPIDTDWMNGRESTVEAIRASEPSPAAGLKLEDVIGSIAEREQENNLSKLLDEALNTGYDVPMDLRIDDRDIPTPANYFEWVRGRGMSGMSGDLFPMQHKILVEYQGEYCPRCSDIRFLAKMHVNSAMDEFEDRIVLLRHGICPQCKITKSELVCNGELNEYYTMNGVAGQRGGKTAVVNVNEGYQTARWLKLPNPQQIYKTLDQQIMLASYCALTFNQVRANLWDPFLQSLVNSPWFKAYHGLLNYYGDKYGEELLVLKDVLIRYRHRGLMLACTGPNKRTMRGATRYSAVIDELGWFPFGDDYQDKEKMSAEQIFESMENSMGTLQNRHEYLLKRGQNNLPKPLMSNISSPSQINDLIMTRHRQSLGSKTSYTFKLPTWEMNPQWPRDSSFLMRKFEQNESDAMRDFGCEPPMSAHAWITNIENAVSVFEGRKNNVALRQRVFTSPSGARQTTGAVDIRTRSSGGRVMCLDAGYVGNSFAGCIAKLHEGVPCVEALFEIIPDKAEVSFPQTYEDCLLPVGGECGVQFVGSDRWESIHTLQRLDQDLHVVTNNKYRCTYADFNALRERIYDASIILPELEMEPEDIIRQHGESYPTIFKRKPVSHLLYQMFTVQDYPGKTVEKGVGSTDDLFRCVVLAVKALTDPEIVAFLDENPNSTRVLTHGAVASLGGMGGARQNSIGMVGQRARLGGAGGAGAGRSAMGVSSSRR